MRNEPNLLYSWFLLTYSDRSQLRASGSEEAAGIEFIDENGGTRRTPSKAAKAEEVRIGDASVMLPWKRAQLATQVICSIVKAVGIEFIDENGGGPGVRLRRPTRQKR